MWHTVHFIINPIKLIPRQGEGEKMKNVSFRCENCGKVIDRNILPMKHAVLGSAYKINQNSTCCEEPEYTDSYGYVESVKKTSWSFIPGLRS